MKKIIIGLSIGLAFAVTLIVSLTLLLQKSQSKQKIMLYNWYDYENREVMTVPAKEVRYSYPYPFSANFTSTSEDIWKQLKNNEIFVDERSCFIDDDDWNGYLMFDENNYYFVFEIEDVICVRNLICTIEYQGLSLVIPLQSIFFLNMAYVPSSKDKVKRYFETITFDESKEFYSRFDTKWVQIEEESQQIIISSLDVFSEKRYSVSIDYNQKQIGVFIENQLQVICESV